MTIKTINQSLDSYEKECEMKKLVGFFWPLVCELWNASEFKDKIPKVSIGPESDCILYFEKNEPKIRVNISTDDVNDIFTYYEELTHALRDYIVVSHWLKEEKVKKNFQKKQDLDVEEWFGALGQKAAAEKYNFKCEHCKQVYKQDYYNDAIEIVRTLKKELEKTTSFKRILYLENLLKNPHLIALLNSNVSIEEILKEEPDLIKKPSNYIREKYLKNTIDSV